MKFTLGNVLQLKYGLYSSAAEEDNKLSEFVSRIKKQVESAYFLYVAPNATTGAYLDAAALRGEPVIGRICAVYAEVISKLNDLSIDELQKALSSIQNSVVGITEDKSFKTYKSVEDTFIIKKIPTDINDRNYFMRKLKGKLSTISSILKKLLDSIEKVVLIKNQTSSAGEPDRLPLTPQKLLQFTFTPAAEALQLDDAELLRKILEYPDLKEKLTTIINALSRGHNPRDWKEFKSEVANLIERFNVMSEKNNSAIFEDEE